MANLEILQLWLISTRTSRAPVWMLHSGFVSLTKRYPLCYLPLSIRKRWDSTRVSRAAKRQAHNTWHVEYPWETHDARARLTKTITRTPGNVSWHSNWPIVHACTSEVSSRRSSMTRQNSWLYYSTTSWGRPYPDDIYLPSSGLFASLQRLFAIQWNFMDVSTVSTSQTTIALWNYLGRYYLGATNFYSDWRNRTSILSHNSHTESQSRPGKHLAVSNWYMKPTGTGPARGIWLQHHIETLDNVLQARYSQAFLSLLSSRGSDAKKGGM